MIAHEGTFADINDTIRDYHYTQLAVLKSIVTYAGHACRNLISSVPVKAKAVIAWVSNQLCQFFVKQHAIN